MSPFLARIIVFTAIFFSIAVDMTEKRKVSNEIWIPQIWFMFSISKPLSYWLYPDNYYNADFNYLEGSPIDRSLYLALMAMAVVILLRRNINWLKFLEKNKIGILLYAFLLISVIWSDYPMITLKRWIKAIGSVLMIIVVLTEKSPSDAIQALFRRSAIILIPLSVLYIKYFREIGIAYTLDGMSTMWVGVTGQKNSLGQLAAVSSLFSIIRLNKKWRSSSWYIDAVILLMSLWILNGSASSSSKTSIVILIIGIATYIFSLAAHKNNSKIEIYGILIILFVILLESFLYAFRNNNLASLLLQMSGRNESLTGRVPLWTILWQDALRNPVLGKGYGSYWIGGEANNLWATFIWKPTQAHNGYLDVFLETGLVGFSLLLIFIGASYRKIKESLKQDHMFGILSLSLFSMMLVSNFTESSFFKPTNYIWFISVLIYMNLINREEKSHLRPLENK